MERLRILDGHSSHVSFEFLKYCENKKCLRSHSIHLLQALDVGLFAPLQRYYSEAVVDFVRLTNHAIYKRNFFPIIRACGMVPYNPGTVITKLQHERARSNDDQYGAKAMLFNKSKTPLDLRQQVP